MTGRSGETTAMMEKVLILAIVQGLTEILPISSSGHLVLAKHFCGLHSPGVTLEVALHVGTLLSILIYYRRSLVQFVRGLPGSWQYAAALAIGTVPAVLVGLSLKDRIEGTFGEPRLAAGMLCVTGVILLSLLFGRRNSRDLRLSDALWIGLAQAIAILPGISRSGSTIAAARHLGVEPGKAGEFSFLLSAPVILGSGMLVAGDVAKEGLGDVTAASLVLGVAVSAAVGYAALAVLARLLSSGRFWLFGVYCLAAGAAGLLFIP